MKAVKNLMIIDDDKLSNFITSKLVGHSKLAKNVKKYYSAKVALRYLQKNSKENQGEYPDIILLDISMYDMSGWEFLKEFEKLDENYQSNITIFILSNSISDKDRNIAEQFTSIQEFFYKPLTIPMIRDMITLIPGKRKITIQV